jgi:hypothetical protein
LRSEVGRKEEGENIVLLVFFTELIIGCIDYPIDLSEENQT